jgi:hypothetical protein
MNNIARNPLAGIAFLVMGLSLTCAAVLTASQAVRAAGIRYTAPAAQGSGDCSSWRMPAPCKPH